MSYLYSDKQSSSTVDQAQLYEILIGELTDFAIFLTDIDGLITSWNPGVERLLGYTETEWLGLPVAVIFTPEDRGQGIPEEEMSKARRDARSPDVRWHLRKNGTQFYVEGTMVALRDETGQLLGFSKVMRDVTERKRREERNTFLVRLDDAMRLLSDPEQMMRTAAQFLGEHLQVDRCTYCVVGPDEETLDILWDYLQPDTPSMVGRYRLTQFGASIAEALRAEQTCIVADTESDPSSRDVLASYRHARVRAHASVPLHKSGKLVAVMAVHQQTKRSWRPEEIDLIRLVTNRCWEAIERARTASDLKDNQARLATALTLAQLGTFEWSLLTGDMKLDDRSRAIFGFLPGEGLTARNVFDRIDPSAADRVYAAVKASQRQRSRLEIEYPIRIPDGTNRTVISLSEPILGASGHAERLFGVFADITERKQMQRALATSEEKLQQIFAQAPVAILVLRGRNFIVELANPSYQALLPGKELVGRPFSEIVPDLEQPLWEALHQVLDSGEPFIANELLIPYDINGGGVPQDHWFNVVYQPWRQSNGSISGVMAILADVSEQVLARKELERVNRELEEFAYVASHDLQEPLRMVNIYTQMILKAMDAAKPNLAQYGGFVRQGVSRMEALIRDLLSYSRTIHRDASPIGSADLDASLTEALSVLKTSIEATQASIVTPHFPPVRGDTKQLAHVFQNLISNALKYRRPEVTPEIQISVEACSQELIVAVRDNGIGFEQKYAEQIFELFNRLHKDEYPGTGLGLAICHRTIERYGGRIWAEGRPSEGATFNFSLPYAEKT